MRDRAAYLGAPGLQVTDLTAGTTRTVDHEHSFVLLSWSPDGTRLLALSLKSNRYYLFENGSWNVTELDLGRDGVVPSHAIWSPDSRTLAIVGPHTRFFDREGHQIAEGPELEPPKSEAVSTLTGGPIGRRIVSGSRR